MGLNFTLAKAMYIFVLNCEADDGPMIVPRLHQ